MANTLYEKYAMQSSSNEKKNNLLEMDYSNTPIPKKIHVIWVGKKKIPEAYLDTVIKMAATGGFEVHLWINNIESISKTLLKSKKKQYPDIIDKNIKKLAGIHIRH